MSFIGMLLMTAVMPAIVLFSGYMMRSCPVKQPNIAVGYRTRRSRASKEAWLFAQEYCGRLWVRLGLWMLPVSFAAAAILKYILPGAAAAVLPYIMFAQIALLLGSVLLTEKALRQSFDAEGKPLARK